MPLMARVIITNLASSSTQPRILQSNNQLQVIKTHCYEEIIIIVDASANTDVIGLWKG